MLMSKFTELYAKRGDLYCMKILPQLKRNRIKGFSSILDLLKVVGAPCTQILPVFNCPGPVGSHLLLPGSPTFPTLRWRGKQNCSRTHNPILSIHFLWWPTRAMEQWVLLDLPTHPSSAPEVVGAKGGAAVFMTLGSGERV